MRDSIPRGPFDQGLFLTHFNKGRDLYDSQRFEEAERELEEAYLLRPRDAKVLNLLGLVYFKQDKLDKAEEVYRKLVGESPEANTLHYNLGLIYFKLSRLEDAESAFLKALELSKGNPKINFYLGSIYERLHRHKDAIYQYRQAGANLMVRRVEDKMAASAPNRPAPKERKKGDDTAEFPKRQIQDSIRRHADDAMARNDQAMVMDKVLQPVSPGLLAEDAPRPARGPATQPPVASPDAPGFAETTARFKVHEDTLPPVASSPPAATPFPTHPMLAISGFASKAPPQNTEPPIRRAPSEIFRFLENNLMEIDFSGKVFIKQGTIYSYGGNLTFWVKDRRPGGEPALVIITGTGKVILTDKDREVTFMQVQDETVFIEPRHLLACEESLTPRYIPVGADTSGLEMLALEGRGMVALSVASKPLALPVTPDLPVSVPASSIITWSGGLTPHIIDDQQIYAVMTPSTGARPGPVIRLEGTGRVLVEQGTA